jgi:hypothetical protein
MRQSGVNGIADIEAVPGAAQIPFSEPFKISSHLILRIESPRFDQTLRQAERHGGIIRPLTGLEIKRSTADHIINGIKGAGRSELKRGAQRVADGQTQEPTAEFSDPGHRLNILYLRVKEIPIILDPYTNIRLTQNEETPFPLPEKTWATETLKKKESKKMEPSEMDGSISI